MNLDNAEQHYVNARDALDRAHRAEVEDVELQSYWHARAQIYATLALACATAAALPHRARVVPVYKEPS
jgi:hypothetical protein